MILEFNESAVKRTSDLLAYWEGSNREWSKLHGVLCLGNSVIDCQDSIELGKLYDFAMIAERLDDLNNQRM